jgi:hypothetical protein
MKAYRRPYWASTVVVACHVFLNSSLYAQPAVIWEAYNDHRPTDLTHPNVSGYDMRVLDDGGPLLNFADGSELDASFFVISESAPDDFGANSPVNDGSPAGNLFNGIVDVGNEGVPGLRTSNDVSLVISFEGLDPSKRYNFRGTASRGGGYVDRWAVYALHSAESFVEAHEDGSDNLNIITGSTFPDSGLEANQVALNSGDNKVGSLVGWDNIEPGPDGIFEIEAQQYAGAAPFGDPASGPYGYGFSAIYLAEIESTGDLRITENPGDSLIPSGTSATLSVGASSPQAIAYQWQKAAAGGADFTDIDGATAASYTTPALTESESGTQYRASLSSGGSVTTSNVAAVTVDGDIPSVTGTSGSANFNAVHLTFSEPMKLDVLANAANYSLSGGLTVSGAVAQSTTTARILTSAQTAGEIYTVTINDLEDLAGNRVVANSTGRFAAFSVQQGVVGLEVWNNTAAGNTNPDDLQIDPRYPDSPDEEFVTTTFDSEEAIPNGPKNTFGARFRAWLTPTETGAYEFFLQSDGGSEFHISEDDDFALLEDLERFPDALAPGGSLFQEPGFDDSASFPIDLKVGSRYAIMVLWKESNGPDYCQLAWRNLNDTATFAEDLQPIPTEFLSFYGPTEVPALPEPPTLPPTLPPVPGQPSEAGVITGISLNGGNVILEFTGAGLESSSDLIGWALVAGATSPHSVAADGEKQFFRGAN